jgi:hypothetical protein
MSAENLTFQPFHADNRPAGELRWHCTCSRPRVRLVRPGQAAKIKVLACSVMGDDWREHDGDADVDIRLARALMIELVGGEPAAQLRDRFAA